MSDQPTGGPCKWPTACDYPSAPACDTGDCGGWVDVPRLGDYCRRCGKIDMNQDHVRVYCPRCHEVTCGGTRQGESMAFPHYRNGPKGRMDRIPCIGGPVDLKEDRAP